MSDNEKYKECLSVQDSDGKFPLTMAGDGFIIADHSQHPWPAFHTVILATAEDIHGSKRCVLPS